MTCAHENALNIEGYGEGGMGVAGVESTVYELNWCPVCGALEVDGAAWRIPTGHMQPATQDERICHGEANQTLLP